MKRSLLLSLGVAMVATVVGAGERAARVTLPMSFGPALVGQNDVVLPPALSPVPDPGYAPSAQYAPPAQYAPESRTIGLCRHGCSRRDLPEREIPRREKHRSLRCSDDHSGSRPLQQRRLL